MEERRSAAVVHSGPSNGIERTAAGSRISYLTTVSARNMTPSGGPSCSPITTVSRPDEERNAGWKGAKGRVNTIAEHYLQTFELPMDDTRVYACGHPGMIEDVKAKMTPQGWKFTEERFWKE